jgi:UDP-N-acetylglucosamine--dolichyl-phosphate N-acetylglucosaminephosphotransferase
MAVEVDMNLDKNWKMMIPIIISAFMSTVAYVVTVRLIPKLRDMFIKANLFGIDMSKTTSEKVPESLGVVTGCTFLITMFLFIPVPFGSSFFDEASFPHDEVIWDVSTIVAVSK